MSNKSQRSLSTTLTGYVAIMGIVILSATFFLFEHYGKKVLYDIEKEKADLITQMFAPQIGVNLYLGMEDRVIEVLEQLVHQKEVAGVNLYRGSEKIHSYQNEKKTDTGDVIKVLTPIYQPGGTRQLGKLELLYKSDNYQRMLTQLTRMLLIFIVALAFFYLFMVYLIRRRLYPLKKLANSLANYDAQNPVSIERSSQDREIGQIEEAVGTMQEKIGEYTEKLTHMNESLYTQVEEKTKALWEQLYTDSLTGLPNRKAMMEDLLRLDTALLAIVNIDDFTEINDLYGHHAGDEILKQLGAKLTSMGFDKVYRASGDEYVIVIKKAFTSESAMIELKRLREAIGRSKFAFEENQIDLRVSIGASIEYVPTIEQADMALKEARKQRVPLMLFSPNWRLEKRYKENIEWISEIKSALKEGRIVTYGQPLYDLRQKRVKGYEMLMRLVKRDGTVVSPFHFLPLAQKTHYYPEMTRRVVEQSCAYFADRKDLTFSINLSVEDILNTETIEFIKTKIEEYHVSNRIIFELLESENIELYPEVAAFVEEMKNLGCQIAIDDFGTGYSNFSYLMTLKVDFLKIDGSLIKNIHRDRNLEVIAETIIDFAHKLNIKTVAEFVSNDQVCHKAHQMGVDIVQGYHIDEPKPLNELEKPRENLPVCL